MNGRCAITVGDLGEFGIVARIAGRLPQGETVLLGPGDDAAVVSAPDRRVVVTTDLLIEGRHFRRDWSSAYEIGRKAAAQNLSDVVAMGADPTGIVVGLGMPAEIGTGWLDDLADGFRDECDLVGASVAGGDTTRCDLVVIGVTALGDLGGRAPVTRSGARPGDVVAVAGRLGHAAAGLALLGAGPAAAGETGEARGGGEPGAPDGLGGLIEAHRRPRPPYSCGPQAAVLGATAMLDVSDGLIQDLGHIAKASGVGIDLDLGSFAVPPEMERAGRLLAAHPLDWVLTGGDDHALAATFPPDVRLPSVWAVVGRVVEGDGVRVGGRAPGRGGWDHFRE
ncbi:thiamine-phosphate kinase [Planomonospora sp. ID67723]|uniref:thiamine-phosphate kinase n=1 Tax=Planomonospora sp. ID67723 TaxID=2738134 RepID=UPI0018C4065E|nr:thiamine-phosphate kinase [Planomonospora sp. ID67723]MBG0832334.1 thiamine-phosphate kinase [Planomonospora sp. ID67723]